MNRAEPNRKLSRINERSAPTHVAPQYTDRSGHSLTSERSLEHQKLGLPKVDGAEDPGAVILPRAESVVIYYPAHKIPKLVSWVTRSSDLVDPYKRGKDFHPDPHFDGPKAELSDYKGAFQEHGITRGHMLRSSERTNRQANRETFNLMNILPQVESNNSGPWLHFEDHYLNQVRDGRYDAHVQAGAIIEPGHATIGDGVTVPTATWKIVVLTPSGQDPATVTVKDVRDGRVRGYAVIIPNAEGEVHKGESFTKYAVSFDEVARRAHLGDLASKVPAEVRALIGKDPVIESASGGTVLNGETIHDP